MAAARQRQGSGTAGARQGSGTAHGQEQRQRAGHGRAAARLTRQGSGTAAAGAAGTAAQRGQGTGEEHGSGRGRGMGVGVCGISSNTLRVVSTSRRVRLGVVGVGVCERRGTTGVVRRRRGTAGRGEAKSAAPTPDRCERACERGREEGRGGAADLPCGARRRRPRGCGRRGVARMAARRGSDGGAAWVRTAVRRGCERRHGSLRVCVCENGEDDGRAAKCKTQGNPFGTGRVADEVGFPGPSLRASIQLCHPSPFSQPRRHGFQPESTTPTTATSCTAMAAPP
nr:uncharacterized protein LOC127310026 [Lolium perenne]